MDMVVSRVRLGRFVAASIEGWRARPMKTMN
jgi:hypothetical protein